MLRSLFAAFWRDESGAVIATEYLMLGSIVALGSATGMAAMRDSIVDEYKEFGQRTRELRQSYSVGGQSGGVASTQGSTATDRGASKRAEFDSQQLRFAHPTP